MPNAVISNNRINVSCLNDLRMRACSNQPLSCILCNTESDFYLNHIFFVHLFRLKLASELLPLVKKIENK